MLDIRIFPKGRYDENETECFFFFFFFFFCCKMFKREWRELKLGISI